MPPYCDSTRNVRIFVITTSLNSTFGGVTTIISKERHSFLKLRHCKDSNIWVHKKNFSPHILSYNDVQPSSFSRRNFFLRISKEFVTRHRFGSVANKEKAIMIQGLTKICKQGLIDCTINSIDEPLFTKNSHCYYLGLLCE